MKEALLLAMEACQPSLARRPTSKKKRQMKRLSCSINYDPREGSVCREAKVSRGPPLVSHEVYKHLMECCSGAEQLLEVSPSEELNSKMEGGCNLFSGN